MDKLDIKRVLRSPSKELTDIALSYVNLTEIERKVIESTEILGRTEERTAEILDLSTRHLHKIKLEAIRKIDIVWSYNLFVNILLNQGA